MKALTDRQALALASYNAGGKIDRGMMDALIRKGAIQGNHAQDSAPLPDEKYVVYNPTKNNRLVRKPGQGRGVMDDAIFANESAAKAFLTRTQRKVAQRVLEGHDGPHYAEGIENWVIAPMSKYLELDTMVERTNLVTGLKYMEDVNTPRHCSPSTEAYWSM